MILVLESGLPQDAVERAGSKIIFWMPSNGHASRFSWMLVLSVAAPLGNHHPTVILDYTQNFTNTVTNHQLLVRPPGSLANVIPNAAKDVGNMEIVPTK